ncbi:MAG TPA: hypothetical protein VK750_08190, partial [Cytophagaceae bacterium]|nr:hypothetical protein [Cytophagaceae bacterium]
KYTYVFYTIAVTLIFLHSSNAQNLTVQGTVSSNTGTEFQYSGVAGNGFAQFKTATTSNSWLNVSNGIAGVNIGIGSLTPHPYLYSSTGKFFIGADGGTPSLLVDHVGNKIGIGMTPIVDNASTYSPVLQIKGRNANQPYATMSFAPVPSISLTADNSSTSMLLGINDGLGSYIDAGNSNLVLLSTKGVTIAAAPMGGTASLSVNGNTTVLGNASLATSSSANVIIGNVTAVNQNYRLFVERGILAERVKVAVKGTANWADYVFDKNYKLMSLENVEAFTKANKHLPGIPSADEVVKEGIDMATMDAKLLEKIEELTLYVIELKKENDAMKVQLDKLSNATNQ